MVFSLQITNSFGIYVLELEDGVVSTVMLN